MKTIEYSPTGISFADASVEKEAEVFLLGNEDSIVVSTSNFIEAVRCLICDDVIPHDQVQFSFNGELLKPTAYSSLPHWPKGFCDYSMNWSYRVVKARPKIKENYLKIS